MSCSQRTLQFFCHHLHFYLYYSNTQTLTGADDQPNSDGLVHMRGKGTVLAPNSFNSWRYLLVFVKLKVNKEITQKGCMSQSVLTKKRWVDHVMIHEGQTSLAVTTFSVLYKTALKFLWKILKMGYEIYLNDAHSTEMWVHSSSPFWEKKWNYTKEPKALHKTT